MRNTIADYLRDSEPICALWGDLLDAVFDGCPNTAHLDRLAPPARVIYLVCMFSGEITNGGFRQFLENTSGNFAGDTLRALRRIGATVSADLLERSLSLFPDSVPPRDQDERGRLLAGRMTAETEQMLNDLDRRAYAEVDPLEGEAVERIDPLLLAYMHANATEPVLANPP